MKTHEILQILYIALVYVDALWFNGKYHPVAQLRPLARARCCAAAAPRRRGKGSPDFLGKTIGKP